MTFAVAIDAEHLETIKAILDRWLPRGYSIFVFGSRATGLRLKPWSDLDLAIDGPVPLGSQIETSLRDAFDEAPVPWKVDVVDLHTISPEFRRIVDATKVPLP